MIVNFDSQSHYVKQFAKFIIIGVIIVNFHSLKYEVQVSIHGIIPIVLLGWWDLSKLISFPSFGDM